MAGAERAWSHSLLVGLPLGECRPPRHKSGMRSRHVTTLFSHMFLGPVSAKIIHILKRKFSFYKSVVSD